MSTCQICGREIKVNKNGLIAHHGYQRPYKEGWQTDSCLGATYPPYEQSHDRIPYVMDLLSKFIKSNKSRLNELLRHPPEKMSILVGDAWSRKTIEVARPIEFVVSGNEYGCYMHNSYESAFSQRQRELKQAIKEAQKDYDFLEERLRISLRG